MFINKKFPKAEAERKIVAFSGFAAAGKSGKGVLAATGGKNCDCADKSIRRGFGWKEVGFGNGEVVFPNGVQDPPEKFAFLPYERENGERGECVVYLSSRGLVYAYCEETGVFEYARKVFRSKPKIVPVYTAENAARLAFCSGDGILLYGREGGFVSVSGTGSAAACAFHERLFFAELPFTVRYTAPLDASDIQESADDGGAIAFPAESGEITDMAVLKESVYIFRRKGIEKLDAKGAARDFVHETLDYGGGRIFENSVGSCGSGLAFLAEDGLYFFDGTKAVPIAEDMGIHPISEGQVCDHGSFEGKYVLKYKSSEGEERLFVWDAFEETGYFASVVSALGNSENRLLCFSDGKLCEAARGGGLPTGDKCGFYVDNSDFGLNGRKVFRSIALKGNGPICIEVAGRYETKRFEGAFQEGRVRFAPVLKGEFFSLKIYPGEGAFVSEMRAEFDVLRR